MNKVYAQCSFCDHIFELVRPDSICPVCNSNKIYQWPDTTIRKHLLILQNLDKKEELSIQIYCVFLSSILESLLKDYVYFVLSTDMLAGDWELFSHIIDIVIDSNNGVNRLLQIARSPSGETFRQDCLKIGHKEFPKKWEKVIYTRNRIVHGNLSFKNKLTKDYLDSVLLEALDVFSKLYNKNEIHRENFKVHMDMIQKKKDIKIND